MPSGTDVRTKADRLRTTAGIASATGALVALAVLAGDLFSEPVFRNVAIGIGATGWFVFAPLYYFVASWRDETAAVEAERRRR